MMGGMYISAWAAAVMTLTAVPYWGEGFPKGWSAGIHYSNKWNGDRLHLNGNYKYNKLNTEAIRHQRPASIIFPDTLYYVNEFGNTYSSKKGIGWMEFMRFR